MKKEVFLSFSLHQNLKMNNYCTARYLTFGTVGTGPKGTVGKNESKILLVYLRYCSNTFGTGGKNDLTLR